MTEAEVLEHIRQDVESQGKAFEVLPKLKQLIELERQFQGIELEARQNEIWLDPFRNGYTIDEKGNVIGLQLYEIKLSNYMLLSRLHNLSWLALIWHRSVELDFLLFLTQLRQLKITYSKIQDLRHFHKLVKLRTLILWHNQISNITPLSNLTQLVRLELQSNQIKDLTALSSLKQIVKLDVSKNQIHDLTPLKRLTQLTKFYSYDNPITSPPPEILSKGLDEIKQFFRQIDAHGFQSVYEAKLLIVGEPEAGKTTLANKLQDPDYELHPIPRTEGIDIITWYFQVDGKQKFRVNIWDFGGQEIYHATHKFFLTKRSLYVIVADTRTQETDFLYWLHLVELLSDNSPILIIQNEKQDCSWNVNGRQLRKKFPTLKEILPTNFATNRGLDNIYTAIKRYLSHLPHIGISLPQKWVEVRKALENDPRNYITIEEYRAICKQYDFIRREDQLQLSEYLHDLGVCLHFQDDDILKKYVILKPEWGTTAVYKILDNPRVINNFGRFTKDDLSSIWSEDKYIDMRGELRLLMERFQLCYQIPNCPDTYIAPQLLDKKQPDYEWDSTNNRLLFYRYKDFMPKNMLSRFIIATHDLIESQRYVWQTGVILEKDGARAEIIERYEKLEIAIRVSGKNKHALSAIVQRDIEKIHNSYKRLHYDKFIPCNCKKFKGSSTPHFYKYNKLIKNLTNDQFHVQCPKSFEQVDVQSLLDDVIENFPLDAQKDWKILIAQGESNTLEFKSTLRYCLRQKSPQKYIEHAVMKTIAAYLNSEGGILLIGVKDNGTILGLEDDFSTFSKKKTDKVDEFLKHFDNLIANNFGDKVHHYLDVKVTEVEGKSICAITIKEKSSEAIWLMNKEEKTEKFYIRRSASTVELSPSEAMKYAREHWK